MDVVIGIILYLTIGLLINVAYENRIKLNTLVFWPLFMAYRIYLDIKHIFGSW